MLGSVIRRALGIRAQVSPEAAVQIARAHCVERSWPWLEPVHVRLGIWSYQIMTNAGMRGGNVNLRVNCTTGAVEASAFARR